MSSALLGVACITQVIATAQEPPAARLPAIDLAGLDLRKTWFTPQLVRGEGALCNTLLADAKRYFATAQDWSGYMSEPFSEATGFRPVQLPYSDDPAPDPSLTPLPDLPFHYMLQVPNQAPLYLYFHRNPGCGGACESQQLVISEQRFQEDMRGRDSLDISGTRAADSWTLYKSEAGAWYAAAVAEDQRATLERYRPPARMPSQRCSRPMPSAAAS